MTVFQNPTQFLSQLLWSPLTVLLVIAAGLLISVRTGWLQLRPDRWGRAIFGSLRRDSSKNGTISPFQSATASLAGTLGTGNIVGVATALTLGGAGSIFWMWISAFFGMIIAYGETVLGMRYRRRDEKGEWLGGPMLYMEHGLGSRRLGVAWALLCSIAALGVGNLTQINSISHSAESAWGVPTWLTSLAAAALAAPFILRGIGSVARLTERLIPFMTIVYLLACAASLITNFSRIPDAFSQIFSGILTPEAAGGGILGAMLVGVRRGIFTNEAGMGSSVLVRCSAETDDSDLQGKWGIFEVFADTVVMCTMTALVILTSGAMGLTDSGGQPLDGAALSAAAFSGIFGGFSGSFITVMLMLFAFATVISWSCCGERAFRYLFSGRYSMLYRAAYLLAIIPGGLMKLRTVWALSDILNALLLIPNIIAVIILWWGMEGRKTKRFSTVQFSRRDHRRNYPPEENEELENERYFSSEGR